jgi:hypothetical protein
MGSILGLQPKAVPQTGLFDAAGATTSFSAWTSAAMS